MSIVQPGSSADVPVIPDSLYKARIVNVKDVTLDKADDYGNTEKVEITLEFDLDGEVQSLDPRVNRKWGEKATLFAIAQAAGLDPDPWQPFETDALKGKQVNILTEQEEGKWPRIKAWSKAAKANGTKPAQAAPAAAQTPSLINADGTLNATAFWLACRAAGIERKEVADAVGGDLEVLATTDPTEIVAMYEILKAGHEGVSPDDVPFQG